MSYVDDLRDHLQAVHDGRVRWIEVGASRRAELEETLVCWFEATSGRASTPMVEDAYRRWSEPEFFSDVVEALTEAITDLMPSYPAALRPALEYALAWIIEKEDPGCLTPQTSPWPPLRTQALERVAEAAGADLLRNRRAWQPQPRRYARCLGLVHADGPRAALTPGGRLTLELGRRSAIRWLLALEAAQSAGPEDPWRVDAGLLRTLLAGPQRVNHHYNAFARLHERGELQATYAALRRLEGLEIVARTGPEVPSSADPEETFELTELGRTILTDLLSEPGSPLDLLARAMAEDLRTGRPESSLWAASREVSAVTDAARHMRMVVHELRNALVPVQIAFDHLWTRVGTSPMAAGVEGYRDTVLAGLARMFRFVDESARVARLTPSPPEPFDALAALGDAVSALQADFARGIDLERSPALRGRPLLLGHRERFVLALVNLLRNAAQATATSAIVGLAVADRGATGGPANLTITIDDDGPGVPVEHRTEIFQPGFTLRDGGSGHGLALVREVIEDEMRGTIVCTNSLLGGARFIVQLPFTDTGES